MLVLALSHDERRGLVVRNAARLAEMPAGIRPTAEGSLTAAEARRLLAAAQGDRLEALLVTGLMLGLRSGELGGLLWEDVDLEAATLQVSRSLKWESGAWRLGDPKTRRSFRAVDLPAPMVEALRAHGSVRSRTGCGPAGRVMDLGLVFASTIGTPLDAANPRRRVAAVRRSYDGRRPASVPPGTTAPSRKDAVRAPSEVPRRQAR